MHDDDELEPTSTRLSPKEFAKKVRKEAYQRAKEFKKNDPRELARKAEAKKKRQADYQKLKEKTKSEKKAKKAKIDLNDVLIAASELDERPLAPVIPISRARRKKPGPAKF